MPIPSSTDRAPPSFHACLALACAVTGMRVALVAEISAGEYRVAHALDKAGLGLSAGMQLDLAKTFCRDVTACRQAICFGDYEQDEAYRCSPLPKLYGLRSYISVPIILADDSVYGTLCTMDPAARVVTEDIVESIHMLAAVVAGQIDLLGSERETAPIVDPALASDERLLASQQLNAALQQEGKAREEFIAVLAHDLRNPLQAIRVTTDLLGLSATSAAQQNLLRHLDHSANRMAELIDVTLDFARGRLGSGVALRLQPWSDLAAILARASEEALAPYPDCTLQVQMALPAIVLCDADRLCQLVANLVINAAIHGATAHPILLQGRTEADELVLEVSNQGQIPADAMATLFEPFRRSEDQRLDSGLGLGLYIASQIAMSHGGTLTATSAGTRTTFTLRIPWQATARG